MNISATNMRKNRKSHAYGIYGFFSGPINDAITTCLRLEWMMINKKSRTLLIFSAFLLIATTASAVPMNPDGTVGQPVFGYSLATYHNFIANSVTLRLPKSAKSSIVIGVNNSGKTTALWGGFRMYPNNQGNVAEYVNPYGEIGAFGAALGAGVAKAGGSKNFYALNAGVLLNTVYVTPALNIETILNKSAVALFSLNFHLNYRACVESVPFGNTGYVSVVPFIGALSPTGYSVLGLAASVSLGAFRPSAGIQLTGRSRDFLSKVDRPLFLVGLEVALGQLARR